MIKRQILISVVLCSCVIFIHSAQKAFLTQQELFEDLDQFKRELEKRSAYLQVNNPEYKSAISAIGERATKGMSVDEFGLELTKVIGLFIDCHARVTGYSRPKGYLPFQIEPINDRYIALLPDHSRFVDSSYPFISKIDGLSIDDWCVILKTVIPNGSAQFVKIKALKQLGTIQFARSLAGQEQSPHLTVELESRDGKTRKSLQLQVSDSVLQVIPWPNSTSHIMEGNIGYLRIKQWMREAYEEIARWMPQFSKTQGLIIDVRHNPGGTRNVLRELYPYFVTESDKPRVAGIAKYRLYRDFGPDHLSSRNMHVQDWNGWSAAERKSISAFMKNFIPVWEVPKEEFSEWHFWVLSKRSNPDAYYYPKPIVFLMDRRCFSASDVILSSVKGMPNVTLLGTPSGGGSGAAISTKLKNSGLRLVLSSMVSFQSSGQFFDSSGVEPDVFMETEPEFYLIDGPDRVLELAVKIISD